MFEEIIWIVLGWFGITFLIPVILSIVALVKISNLKKEIRKLKTTEKEVEEEIFEDEKVGPRYVVKNSPIQDEKDEVLEIENHDAEVSLGSKWLTIVGVVSVIFGVGFFLDYAFSNNLISEAGRIILGFISGIIFVIVGDRFKNELKDYAHYLIGGGFALIMLSAYFGLDYDLYSNTVAFLIMILTTLMSGFLAHKLDSKILAGTTILAGFLAPILASSGVANEIILFNYILILLGGMFWLVVKHGWNFLIWGSLLGTVILYGGSMAEYYTNSVFWIYWIYLIIFFVIFAYAPVYSYLADKKDGLDGNLANLIISALAGGIFMIVSYFMFETNIFNNSATLYAYDSDIPVHGSRVLENMYWVIGLIPLLVYLWLSKNILKKQKNQDRNLLYSVIGMAVLSIAMIPALQFSGKWITFAWLIEALILGYIFYKNDIKIFLNLALVSLAAGLFRLFGIDSELREGLYNNYLQNWVYDFMPIFNERTLIYLIAVVTTFSIVYFAFKKGEKEIAKWWGVIGNFFILFWIYLELDSSRISDYISRDVSSLLLSVFYLVYGGVLIWIGILKKYTGFRLFGLGLIAFVILKTYLVDIWGFDEITRILAFVILGIFVLIIAFYYSKISKNLKKFLEN